RVSELLILRAVSDLRNKSQVGPELVAVVLVVREKVPRTRLILIPEVRGRRSKLLSIPLGGDVRSIRRLGIADKKLAGDRVPIVLPLKIGTEDAVVSSAFVL